MTSIFNEFMADKVEVFEYVNKTQVQASIFILALVIVQTDMTWGDGYSPAHP